MSTVRTLENSDKELQRLVVVSLVLHVLVLSGFAINVRFRQSESLLFQSAVRVDMVGLPDKIEPESAPPPQALPQPQTKAETVTPVPSQTTKAPSEQAIDLKKKQSSALERLKALQAIESLKQSEAAKASRPIKGNVLSAGSAIQGLARGEYNAYISQIDSHIKSNWILPEWMQSAGLRARILVKFDERGLVTDRKLVLSSGQAAYDEAAMEAVVRSSPFPAPPEKFREIVSVDGITFQFPD